MIVSRIFGGLGNQLFQYATGRAVASRNSVPLVLDTRDANRQLPHLHYALEHFAIKASVGTPRQLPPDRSSLLRYAVWRWLGASPKFTREKGLRLNPDVLTLSDGCYLHGYFQTEKYFQDVQADLREELCIVTPPSDENARAIEQIGKRPSVSVHLRRGDYLSSNKGNSTYGSCDAEYYQRALQHIATTAEIDPTVFVFSDDPGWVSDNLDLGFETVTFDQNGPLQHYEDMRLMSACAHNIIANSTFSWWGAWLNPAPKKIVVAPRNWFAEPSLKNPDIIPESWIQL